MRTSTRTSRRTPARTPGRSTRRLGAALAAAPLCLPLVGATSAQADEGSALRSARAAVPNSACDYYLWYRYSGVKSSTRALHHNTGAPGTTISTSIAAGATITGTVGGSGSFSVSGVVVGAQAQVNASLSLSVTATVSDSASWFIPKNHKGPGRLYVGARTNWMNWYRYRQNGNCTVVRVGKGTANLPLDVPYFWHV